MVSKSPIPTSVYEYYISGIAPKEYPTEAMFGLLWTSQEKSLDIPMRYPYAGDWGTVLSTMLLLETHHPIPCRISLLWLSIVEKKFYFIEDALPAKKMEDLWQWQNEDEENLFTHLVVGMAPHGGVAVWLRGYMKSVCVAWLKAKEIDEDINDFVDSNSPLTLDEYCKDYMAKCHIAQQNLIEYGLPLPSLYERKMAQFTYRYIPVFAKWDEKNEKWNKYEEKEVQPVYDALEEALTDGTHDKLNDGSRLKHHQAGLPDKLALSWHIKKSDYHAYFWFDEETLGGMFRKISMDRQQSVSFDLIIHVDAERKKYEVSLYRYGMEKPLVVPETGYQYIVFKSKFENTRSENYAQTSGAWIW